MLTTLIDQIKIYTCSRSNYCFRQDYVTNETIQFSEQKLIDLRSWNDPLISY